MNNTTGRWKTGFALALTAAVLWGVLPIALAIISKDLDSYTLTWFRFAVAGLVLALILAVAGGLPAIAAIRLRTWLLLAVALAGLAGNYVMYVIGLSYTSPTIAQNVTQLGPIFLLFGGLLIFKERFSSLQWKGFAVLVIGLPLFFNDRLPDLAHPSQGMGLGVAVLIVATFIWSFYGLAQKRLLSWFRPQQILLLLYVGAVIFLLPWTSLQTIGHLTTLQLSMLGFCCFNTLVAYGAFAEALKHWEVSRIGAVLSTSPLFTVAGMWTLEAFAPQLVAPEHLNTISILGMILVVIGSATCALGRRS